MSGAPPRKLFYGWRIVGASAGIQFLHSALMGQVFGAYIAMLGLEKGWSKTALSGAAALQSVESALMGPLQGWFVDRFGPRGVVRAGIVIFGLGLMALSQVESLGGFYAAVIMIAIGTSIGGYFPLTVTILHWFEKYRARALSLRSLGMAMGGLLVPLLAWVMQTWGWRGTAFGSGVVAILLGWPLASMIYGKPSDRGDTIDGVPEPLPANSAADFAATPKREFTARQALQTRAFWLLGLGHASALLVVTAVNVHAISHMKESLGYSLAQASIFITLLTVSQGGGLLIGWIIGERYDKRHVAASCMLMHAGGLLLLTYATGPWTLGAFALVHGVAWGLRGPFMEAIRADYFGRHAIGMILGLTAFLLAMGQIGGPMISGVLADLTGDYRTGFTLLALVAALGAVLFLKARKPE